MNREDFERINKLLYEAIDPVHNYSDDEIFIIYKFKEIEVLEDIAKILKSVSASLRGDKL